MATAVAGEYVEAPPEVWRTNYQLPMWTQALTRYAAMYKVVYGGRASSKSWGVAASILYLITQSKRPLTVMILREKLVSIDASAMKLCKDLINMIYAGQGWVPQKTVIYYPANGSVIRFRGMSDVTESSMRSIEGVDIFWFEEAQYMSRRSATTLYPTVRANGAELWFTFNPRFRSDPVWADFLTDTRRSRNAIVLKINFDSNPWLSDRANQERLAFMEDQPDRYAHEYLGEPDDEGATRKVLTYAMVRACVEAWDKWAPANGYQPDGRVHVGLDLADTGADFNAQVARRGPLIFQSERWTGSRRLPESGVDPEEWNEVKSLFTQTARRADSWCREHSASRLYYDQGGIGGPARSIFTELHNGRPSGYRRRGIKFDGPVTGQDVHYLRGVLNKDHFHRRGDQLGWNLNLRAMRTQRLLDGKPINPDHCLFIDRTGMQNLDRFMDQMSQPEWSENSSGKIVIEKCPRVSEGSTAKMPSPDLYDGARLAFAFDSRRGLKARAA